MPRSLKEILEHADELQQRFERHQPDDEAIADAGALRGVRQAALGERTPFAPAIAVVVDAWNQPRIACTLEECFGFCVHAATL